MKEASETTSRPISPPQQQLDPKDKGKYKMVKQEKPLKKKDQVKFDEELAQRLSAQLQAELEEEERQAKQEEEDANIAEWDDVQAMINAYYELAARLQAEEQGELTIEERLRLFVELMDKRKRYKHTQLKSKSYDEIQKLFDKEMKRVNTFVDMDSEVVEGSGKNTEISRKKAHSSKKRTRTVLDEESVKRQKVEDDAEKADLKACLEIVPSDDSAVNVESLATKYPIVDYKTHILAEDKIYYQIIRVDESTKYYKIFSAMLNDFDRQDVLDLYRLVKERFETTSPEGYDILLWGDLITLFEPSEEDEIWKAQLDYTLISWRLDDSCGVHLLLMDTGITIHMLGRIVGIKRHLSTVEVTAANMEVTTAGYVSTADEDCRKYSKSLLLLVVKLLLLVLVTTVRVFLLLVIS
ncbi:hypothetical protein Tco_0812862 [Tanacetum coccineum]